MRLLKTQDYPRMPWKNGGGETVQIAAFPPEASLDTFHWRVSMAKVRGDGRFSRYPGVERSVALLDGGPLVLALDGARKCRLVPGAEQLSFAGEAPAYGCLLGQPFTEFNVMSRRAHCRHQLQWYEWDGTLTLTPAGGYGLLFVQSGSVEAGPLARLGRYEALLLEAGEAVPLFSDGPAAAWWVEFFDS